ncbi:MAG: alpha/beta hydrolase [Rhodospirillales bacterium]|nr:alpha/beta hydrolase [Rhodospirillales bacterium]
MPDDQHLIDGSADAPVTVILAHGAGAPMDSPFMQAFGDGLAKQGLRCVRFEFPYMAERRVSGKKKPPNRMSILMEYWHDVVNTYRQTPLVIGGKSMGGRVASMITAELDIAGNPIAGLACLSYPFHPPGKPENLRLDHFADLKTPTLILQGTRDPFGTREEVDGFILPPCVRIHWLEDGEHGLKPRKKSGRTEQQNWQEAIDTLAAFALRSAGV